MGKFDTKVLCIESRLLFESGKWNGMQVKYLDRYYKLLIEKSEFRKRGDLEDDPNYKQIIPQVILKHSDKYFLHKQVDINEKRLENMYPLPLGGHVEEFDVLSNSSKDLIQNALDRELEEEAQIRSKIISRDFKGLIYLEDENPVNHVHVGLMYVFELDGENVEMIEDGLETVGWVDIDYLKNNIDTLTYWSRVFVNAY